MHYFILNKIKCISYPRLQLLFSFVRFSNNLNPYVSCLFRIRTYGKRKLTSYKNYIWLEIDEYEDVLNADTRIKGIEDLLRWYRWYHQH